MADKTGIQWTEATWNPLRGCTRVSEGCRNCYAESIAARFSGPGQPYEGLAEMTPSGPRWTNRLRLVEEHLEQPLRWKRPRKIFVNSMSDLFHKDVPDDFIGKVFDVMLRASWHTFQVLTKRPERMLEFCQRKYPSPIPNVWLGVSVEDQKTASARIPLLLQTPAAVRFLSCEPLLGLVDLARCVEPSEEDWEQVNMLQDEHDDHEPEELVEECEAEHDWVNYGHDLVENPEHREWRTWRRQRAQLFALGRQLHWVIAGGESGSEARPMHPDWARSLRDECQAAGIPFFFKQWGAFKPEYQRRARAVLLFRDGRIASEPKDIVAATNPWNRAAFMTRVGKKAAGRLLDDRTWDEYPQVAL